MSGLLDKVILAGFGLEHKVKERVNSLAKEGKPDAEEGRKMKEDMENRMVESIVEVVGGALKKVGIAKKEVDAVLGSLAEDAAERLKIVTMDDLDVVEKLVMVNREKVSKLEKQVKKLEKALLDLSSGNNKE
jgi:BMFP domain-containing protein YqiC